MRQCLDHRETVPESEAVSNLRGSPDTEAAVLEQKTKAILEEYFGLKDTAEAYLVSALQLSPSRNFCTFLI